MSSGKLFQSWAATTGKARLPTVDSLTGGTDDGRQQNATLVDQVDQRRGVDQDKMTRLHVGRCTPEQRACIVCGVRSGTRNQ